MRVEDEEEGDGGYGYGYEDGSVLVDLRGADGDCALMRAARRGFCDAMRLLLRGRARL